MCTKESLDKMLKRDLITIALNLQSRTAEKKQQQRDTETNAQA